MGVYEFNHKPVAVTGLDQAVSVLFDDFVEITLDGSASYDDDNDVLNYYWSWTVDGNDYDANGVSPIIQLPVGEYQIQLIVDDGIDESEPDYCTITVGEPLNAELWTLPRVINCNARAERVLTVLTLPEGIEPADIKDQPLIMYPGQIESRFQHIYRTGWGRHRRTVIIAVFERDDICACLEQGPNEINVVGQLNSDQYFSGTDNITIIQPNNHRWRRPFRQIYFKH